MRRLTRAVDPSAATRSGMDDDGVRVSTSRCRCSSFACRSTGRARHPVILLWLATAAAAYRYLPGIRATQGGEIGLLAPANSAAIHTEEASSRLFAVLATDRCVGMVCA